MRIENGDIVEVSFANVGRVLCERAAVLHRPVATGDGWEFKDVKTGTIYYVSEGCTVIRHELPQSEKGEG